MKNKLLLVSLIIPMALIVGVVMSFFDQGVNIYPGGKYHMGAFSDTGNGGNSLVLDFKSEADSLIFRYELRDKISYPFTGIYIDLKKQNRFLDLSAYSYMELELESDYSQDIRLVWLNFMPKFSKTGFYDSYRHIEFILSVYRMKKKYRVPLSKFTTAAWWYQLNNTNEALQGKECFNMLDRFQIQNGPSLGTNTRDTIWVYGIRIKKEYGIFRITAAALLIMYTVVFIGLKLYHRKNIYSYTPALFTNIKDRNTELINDYISSNYTDPGLSLESIYRSTGIYTDKISGIIREHYGQTFKQVLNDIRITEAKRLLLESDHNIIDIAGKVGYNTVTHFNRIFREKESVSPKEFRKTGRKTPRNDTRGATSI